MRYKIADCITEYEPKSGFLREKMKAYLCEETGEPDIVLAITEEFCTKKQKEQPHLTVPQCEYIFAGAGFYREFIRYNGMMIHASAVEVDGQAYLFSADSGTGKSTHTKLWQKLLGENRAVIINDDKPAVRKIDGKWFAYGTPFSGKTGEQLNRKVKLKGICMLERGEKNRIERLAPEKAILPLMRQTIVPKDEKLADRMLETLDGLLAEVPVWKMECNMSEDAARLAFETMGETEYED